MNDYVDVVKTISNSKSEVGSHSFSHVDLSVLSKEEINNERDKMADLLFDYYDDNCVIEATVIKNHEEKSALECFSESIFFMSQVDVLAMGFGWENARGCKLEHQIAKAYGLSVVYLDDIKKKLEE